MIFENNSFISKFKKLFVQPKPPQFSPIPPWDEIVEMMYDAQLDAYDNEVVRVIYSADRTMRYVILQDEKGFYTYHLEAIYPFDEDEWKYIFSGNSALPAMWEPFHNIWGLSIFSDEQELLREMKAEPEYKRYFT